MKIKTRMKNRTWLYALLIVCTLQVLNEGLPQPFPKGIYAQSDETPAQKNLKREKKKRMKSSAKAENASKKRHIDIQTKATQKRMKKHLKLTKKNVKSQHR